MELAIGVFVGVLCSVPAWMLWAGRERDTWREGFVAGLRCGERANWKPTAQDYRRPYGAVYIDELEPAAQPAPVQTEIEVIGAKI